MKHFVKTVSLISMLAVIPTAFAATSRVGVNKATASSRLPSIAGHLVSGTTTTTTTSSSSTTYYGDSDCIEKYTDCIKSDDTCGSDMSECTTNVLFHAQMPNCLSVLYQCQSSGINALFGTSTISALSNVSSTNSEGEVTKYVYPTDGSVLGQLIVGAGIANKLTTEQCVRRYTNCLKRDDICGSDFELCTDNKSFKKQAMLCDSTLARCQSDGKKELFGSVTNAENLNPQGDSRLKQLVEEGAALAALNAVKTCQKVTDTCLINACVKNPLRCVEGINTTVISAADFVSGGSDASLAASTSSTQNLTNGYVDNYVESLTGSDIRKMLKAQCLDTIGANKYCHMTYREKSPSNKDLVDIDLQEDVFSLAYSARKDAVNTKIQEEVKKFDTKAKNKCIDTIKACAMRSCGGGLGSVCYRKAGNGTTGIHINNTATYNEVQAGCAAVVNADANCIYAATAGGEDGYTYTYYDDNGENSTFNKLFPAYTGSEKDPIGAVATLNSLLSTNYNDAAIEKMKKQCQTIALSCVKSMCGKEYTNCYRNRTDIVSGSYDTGSAKFDRSMNKMGGVIDYNIVMGLCMNTVKNSSVCEEHLKVATATWRDSQDNNSWGSSNGVDQYQNVRDAWLDANTTKVNKNSAMNSVVIGCRASNQTTVGGGDCSGTMEPIDDKCIGVMDEDGCVYDQEVTVGMSEYVLENGAKSLFQTLLADVEKEAQAVYNAKLTKEQNVCLSNNNGGIMGRDDNGSTFMWVKLKSSKLPKNYQNNGLNTKQFQASNDLYGSFCRARVTILSDDKDIQDALGKDSVAYFAVGDSFTCGSWISSATLQKISETVGERELCKQGYGKWVDGKCDGSKLSVKEKLSYSWATIGGALGGGALGLGLTESGLVSKLMTKGNEKNGVSQATIDKLSGSCSTQANSASSAADEAKNNIGNPSSFVDAVTRANGYASTAYTACSKMGISEKDGCKNFSITYKQKTDKNGNVTIENQEELKTKIASFKSSMTLLESTCGNYVNSSENGKAAKAARVAIPIATTLAGGALGAGITASVIKAKKENIQNEAAQKWMDEVGEHIQCYLGTDELGSYGDVVSIELD